MSPSIASCSTKAGSFFSSCLWKRVFSKSSTSPFFIAAIAFSATSPTQSSAKPTWRSSTWASSAATGFHESFGSRPFGGAEGASRITLPPFAAISVMVGATRSMRVASVTLPFSIGTLRSTRTSTRLPATSAESRGRNALMPAPARGSEQLPHRHGRIGHAVGKAPLVVVPRHDADKGAADDLCLIDPESGRVRIVVEIGETQRLLRPRDDLAQPVRLRRRHDGLVDLFDAGG